MTVFVKKKKTIKAGCNNCTNSDEEIFKKIPMTVYIHCVGKKQ